MACPVCGEEYECESDHTFVLTRAVRPLLDLNVYVTWGYTIGKVAWVQLTAPPNFYWIYTAAATAFCFEKTVEICIKLSAYPTSSDPDNLKLWRCITHMALPE